jgi:uncharacterized protein
MSTRRANVIIGLVVTLLGACAATPDMRFYTLSNAQVQSEGSSFAGPVVVGPIELPEYLDRLQIVTRQSGNELTIAELHRWAEPLERGFLTTLVADLRDAGPQVHQFPVAATLPWTKRVVGRVSQFDAESAGLVHLVVQWNIVDHEGHAVLASRLSRYETRVGKSGDYRAIVQAMSEAVRLFARDVAAAL